MKNSVDLFFSYLHHVIDDDSVFLMRMLLLKVFLDVVNDWLSQVVNEQLVLHLFELNPFAFQQQNILINDMLDIVVLYVH